MKKLRILNITTYNEDCGIAKFQANIQEALHNFDEVDSVIYSESLNVIKKLPENERKLHLLQIAEEAKAYDVVHIQHEFGLFFGLGIGFGELVKVLKKENIKIVVTIHTAPSHVLIPNRRRLTMRRPRSSLVYLLNAMKNSSRKKSLLNPFLAVDGVIALNKNTATELQEVVGVDRANIYHHIHPVRNDTRENKPKSKEARLLLSADDEDIILVANGFINSHKGFDKAVKALRFLPDNYKLLIAGGINPDSGRYQDIDRICDLISQYDLNERVYITGYIKDDDKLASLIGGCDIALYPYDVNYYRLASSGAVGVAVNEEIPIIAYPAESFVEINTFVEDVINTTSNSSYIELSREVMRINKEKQKRILKSFKEANSYTKFVEGQIRFYKKLIN